MGSLKKALVGLSVAGVAATSLVLAPAAMADSYSPDLPSRIAQPSTRVTLTIEGAQVGCRVTYSIEDVGGNVVRGPSRSAIEANGQGTSSLKTPANQGRYRLITRVDNFQGQTGCTPSKSVQRFVVR